MITVTSADMTDRDTARELPWRLRITMRTASRPRGAKGFVTLPRRWKLWRTIGWVMNVRDSDNWTRKPTPSD